MNYDRSLLFSYLEEDNIQRAYFRVRPLLTSQGDVRAEAAQLWPNEGGLRIVPDRNEQHTFKVRMRTLGSFCVVDLRDQPAEAGKIRTNKNYRPDRGEVNQYILYSDTVHELPENSFYQVLSGKADDYSALATEAITPLFFIREDDTFYGPVCKTVPARPETAKAAEGILVDLPCPDGVNRLMLCMDDAPAQTPSVPLAKADDQPADPQAESEAPVPAVHNAPIPLPEPAAPAAKDAAPAELPIAEKLTILEADTSHEDALRRLDKPVSTGANLLRTEKAALPETTPVKTEGLSGTPLIQMPLRMSASPAKNRTQEAVHTQCTVGKYEPPAQPLPNGTRMRDVLNPVETACTHFRSAWHAAGAHEQLADFILGLEGVRPLLEKKLCSGNHVTVTQHVLRGRLHDLEAERLTALCELDKANRDLDSYKQQLISGMAARIAKETAALEAACTQAREQADCLKAQVNALTHQRDALEAKIAELQSNTLPEAAARLMAEMQFAAPAAGIPLRMSPIAGEKASSDEIITRLMGVFEASGVAIDRNMAIVLIVLLARSRRIGLSCATPAPLATLVHNCMAAMGWLDSYAHQYAAEQKPVCGARPVDATPAVLMTSLPNFAPIDGLTKLCLNRSAAGLIRNAAYDAHPWPVLILPNLPFVPEIEAKDVKPVSFASLQAVTEKEYASFAEIDRVLAPILQAAIPLSGASRKEMHRFVAICAGLLEGGLPVAIDWAILLWIVPALEKGTRNYAAVKALLDEFPLSLSKL